MIAWLIAWNQLIDSCTWLYSGKNTSKCCTCSRVKQTLDIGILISYFNLAHLNSCIFCYVKQTLILFFNYCHKVTFCEVWFSFKRSELCVYHINLSFQRCPECSSCKLCFPLLQMCLLFQFRTGALRFSSYHLLNRKLPKRKDYSNRSRTCST